MPSKLGDLSSKHIQLETEPHAFGSFEWDGLYQGICEISIFASVFGLPSENLVSDFIECAFSDVGRTNSWCAYTKVTDRSGVEYPGRKSPLGLVWPVDLAWAYLTPQIPCLQWTLHGCMLVCYFTWILSSWKVFWESLFPEDRFVLFPWRFARS